MNAPAQISKRLWLALIAGSSLLVAGGFWMLSPPAARLSPSGINGARKPPVSFAQLQGANGDEALLLDPMPLYLPTSWNAAQGVRPESSLREPGNAFSGYEAKFVFPETEVNLNLPSPIQLPESPTAAIRSCDWSAPFFGFGQKDFPEKPLERRGAFIEVHQASDGQKVIAQASEDFPPPAAMDWQPLEFLVAMEPGGIIGTPYLLNSSGSENIDHFFQEFLLNRWRAGDRLSKLAPGIYRIYIGP